MPDSLAQVDMWLHIMPRTFRECVLMSQSSTLSVLGILLVYEASYCACALKLLVSEASDRMSESSISRIAGSRRPSPSNTVVTFRPYRKGFMPIFVMSTASEGPTGWHAAPQVSVDIST